MDVINLDTPVVRGADAPPASLQTFVELLQWRAERTPDRLALSFTHSTDQVASLTYAQLNHAARAVAQDLRAQRCVGERAVIMLPPGVEYIFALLGCWYARMTAVPMPAPHIDNGNTRVRMVLKDAGARVLISTRAVLDGLGQSEWKSVSTGNRVAYAIDQVNWSGADNWTAPAISPQTLALLQYTSGATGEPKGVRLQHRQLMKSSQMLHQAMANSEQDVAVVCLPLHHGMELMSGVLQPLYGGYPVHLLAPSTFLAQPLSWLEVISRHRATITFAPSAVYDLCSQAPKTRDLTRLDLSTLRLATNGAEPLRQQTLDAFGTAFLAQGFRPQSFFPCYGVAESTLLIAAGDPHQAPRQLTLDRDCLSAGALQAATSGVVLVSCGHIAPEASLCIVDPHTLEPVAEGRVGEIWVSGPMVADGYWKKPQATWETFHATLRDSDHHWLRTGDLGAMLDQQLYITGRMKELIVADEHQHYPSDIESTVMNTHPAVRIGVDRDGKEHPGLVIERRQDPAQADAR
ncbi:fatty acyl-AMP ligase [Pseudomonas frederiksbergensis]|uniref:AMP-dependent synthetase/ligase domain-containing protein n=1 Tax=Pseudomonas frederiksbergensis TaxID=104087 RepID=A0A423HP49_9PSED|nr:fatty acyl-AMP ligase [Pseudomonas frederiksbergensis]RON14942.1 hypothetical protein BK662_15720 [Pseudomonas frederiksbergensis]